MRSGRTSFKQKSATEVTGESRWRVKRVNRLTVSSRLEYSLLFLQRCSKKRKEWKSECNSLHVLMWSLSFSFVSSVSCSFPFVFIKRSIQEFLSLPTHFPTSYFCLHLYFLFLFPFRFPKTLRNKYVLNQASHVQVTLFLLNKLLTSAHNSFLSLMSL